MKQIGWMFMFVLVAICVCSFGFEDHPSQPFDTIRYDAQRGWIATGGQYGNGTTVGQTKIRVRRELKDGIGTIVIIDTLRVSANDPINGTLSLVASIFAKSFQGSWGGASTFLIKDMISSKTWRVDLNRCSAVDLEYDAASGNVKVFLDNNCTGVTRPN